MTGFAVDALGSPTLPLEYLAQASDLRRTHWGLVGSSAAAPVWKPVANRRPKHMRQTLLVPHRTDLQLRVAGMADVDLVEPLVAEYHVFEGISSTRPSRLAAISRLVGDADLGTLFLIEKFGALIGYIAVCLGYSIELGGRDAFVDEFLVLPEFRGGGIGTAVLAAVTEHCDQSGVMALHLEVSGDNRRAKSVYARAGFVARARFHLMTRRSIS